MNRISKAGCNGSEGTARLSKQERFESGNHESRKSKQFRRFLVSWIPDFLLLFSCVPAFMINSSSAADVVIGSKKFTESYVLGEIAKRTLTMREFQRNTARAWVEQLFCGGRCGADRSTLIRNIREQSRRRF